MTDHGRGTSAAALAVALALTAGNATAATLPLELEDPLGGQTVRVEPGPALVHVVLFATWCPPCVAELDGLREIEARWEERGYRLLVVAVETRHSRERLAEYSKSRRVPGRLLFDAHGATEAALGASGLPAHVLFDGAGKEIFRASSLGDGVVEAVERALAPGPARGRPH